ncbi:MAG: outer membrane protein, partial [Xanthobacteraceae bacterium]
MKKFLLAGVALAALSGSAVAADLARPAYAPPPPMYSWTGLYWGVNVGYSWGRDKNQWNLIAFGAVSESQKMDGVIGGFQSGYNYQFGQWVLGLETDIQASGQKGSTIYGIAPGVTLSADHKLPWFGTSRTRLGVLVSPTVLLYGTAGIAYGQVKQDYTLGV